MCQLCGAAVDTEEHFLRSCRFFTQEREALFAELELLVSSAAAADEAHDQHCQVLPLHAAPPPKWRVLDESSESQLQLLLCCAPHPRFPAGPLQSRAHRLILIAVGRWMQQHDEHRRRIRAITVGE